MVVATTMSTPIERWIGSEASAGRRARVGGGIFFAAGLFLLKVSVLDPLRDAERHDASALSISSAVAIVPPVLILGALLLIAGPRAAGVLRRMGIHRQADGRRPLRGWLFLGALVAPGLLLHFWLQHRLSELGYRG